MAQTKRYHLAGTTDLSAGASWHDGVLGASAVPLISNVVYFTEGSDNITTGLSALDAAALAYVGVTRGFKGRIGSSGTSATLRVNTNGGAGEWATETFEYAAGGGYAYIAASATGGIDLVRCNSLGKLYLTGGAIPEIQAKGGQLHINDQVSLSSSTLRVYEGADVEVEWKADGTDPTLNMYGGVLFTKRTWGTVNLRGGLIIAQVEKEANWCATLNIDGGAVDWRAGQVATAINFNSGACSFKNLTRPIDISAATITAGDTAIDMAAQTGSKITWPATTSITFQLGQAALSIARVAAAAV